MNETAQYALWGAILVAPLLIVLAGVWVFRVDGLWLRDDLSEELHLRQRLVFVTGRSEAVGGWHEFTGYVIGPWLFLERRDHGQGLLEGQGFPPPVARQVSGTVVARLKLWRRDGGTELAGSFVPQQVLFAGTPPQVVQRNWQAGRPRRYVRTA